jgi:hypothetical protein
MWRDLSSFRLHDNSCRPRYLEWTDSKNSPYPHFSKFFQRRPKCMCERNGFMNFGVEIKSNGAYPTDPSPRLLTPKPRATMEDQEKELNVAPRRTRSWLTRCNIRKKDVIGSSERDEGGNEFWRSSDQSPVNCDDDLQFQVSPGS